MEHLNNYLAGLRGDIFKLLPMKEAEIEGADNHILDYLETIIINMEGAKEVYPELAKQKQYLYVINNMHFLLSRKVEYSRWRKIILNSTKSVHLLFLKYGGNADE